MDRFWIISLDLI